MKISATAQVPATSANLGPGFDTLGVALNLYNQVTVTRTEAEVATDDLFLLEASDLFFKIARAKAFAFTIKITGEVPSSRGLGSSVTVRLGLLMALNKLSGSPLSQENLTDLTTELEGHPDNAIPAAVGGFVAAGQRSYFRTKVSPRVKFVALIPSHPLETAHARKVLPKKIAQSDAVKNLQGTAAIVGAFASGNYELLRGNLNDTIHQPHRGPLIRGFDAILAAAQKKGALATYLSGAGSTLMAIATQDAEKIARAMKLAASKAGDPKAIVKILQADNRGATLLR